MAFNFNWSPLTADADFYLRAQDLLTTALNKSPKPPIIVDDILVNELNLGSVPPDLEILEIGDLAEDRFRGIFKMCYSGDAFLTLKTKVQANPLNTYLFSKPSFTSPQPLAASSGLTIPLQITLSDIKLSAFIILVFSRQKGLTLVFRNDPLESLKVSSTFDSIPFVRDYLQKEIEAQLRNLMMDELPAIIHRLSLRLWCPDYRAKEDLELQKSQCEVEKEEIAIDPLASPPLDAVDARGNVLDASEISQLALDGGSESQSLFSQKSLLRLAALTDSHRTLSLFTPSIRDAVFRAWAGPAERGESAGISTPAAPGLVRTMSQQGSTTTYTFTDASSDNGSLASRPSLVNLHSATSGLSMGAGRHSRSYTRKKKTRVVNLRKKKDGIDDSASESGGSVATSESSAGPSSEPAIPPRVMEEPDEEPLTPPRSPNRVRFQRSEDVVDLDETPRRPRVSSSAKRQEQNTPVPGPAASSSTHRALAKAMDLPTQPAEPQQQPQQQEAACMAPPRPGYQRSTSASAYPLDKGVMSSSSSSTNLAINQPRFRYAPSESSSSSSGGAGFGGTILEQAWIMKMAGEIARRSQQEKSMENNFWASQGDRDEAPPPAYGT